MVVEGRTVRTDLADDFRAVEYVTNSTFGTTFGDTSAVSVVSESDVVVFFEQITSRPRHIGSLGFRVGRAGGVYLIPYGIV